jgi:hypothetical protein
MHLSCFAYSQVRRGKPGAGLPAEPWAPTPTRLPTWPLPEGASSVQEDDEEVMPIARAGFSHMQSREVPKPLRLGHARDLSSSPLSAATSVAPVLGSNDGRSAITVPTPTPVTTATTVTNPGPLPRLSSDTWQLGRSILELSEPNSDEEDDEGANDDDEIKYPGLLAPVHEDEDNDDHHPVINRRHHHHQNEYEEDFGVPLSPSSPTFSRIQSDAVFSWKVDELVSKSPTQRMMEAGHSPAGFTPSSPSSTRRSEATSASGWCSTYSSASSSSSCVSAEPIATRSTSVDSSLEYLDEDKCLLDSPAAVDEYNDDIEEQDDEADDNDDEGHASDREFYAHHSDYSSSYCSYSSSSSEYESHSSSLLAQPAIPVRQSTSLAMVDGAASTSNSAALFEPGTSANTIRAAASPIYWACHRSSMVYVGPDVDEGDNNVPSKDVWPEETDTINNLREAEVYAPQPFEPEPASEQSQHRLSVATSTLSSQQVPAEELLAADVLTQKLMDVQDAIEVQAQPRLPTDHHQHQQPTSSPPTPARRSSSSASGASTGPSLAARWLRHVRSFHKPVQPPPPSTSVPASSTPVVPKASSTIPPVPPLPANLLASTRSSRAIDPTRIKMQPAQQRVFIGDMQRFSVVEVSLTTTAADLLGLLDDQGALDGWRGSGGWMVYEVALDFGMGML